MMGSNQPPVDKELLYGKFQQTEDWQDKLNRKLAHKALDIRDADDMNVTNHTSNGMGWKELGAIGLMIFGGGFGLANLADLARPDPAPDPPPAAAAEDTDTDHVNVLEFVE